MYKKKLIVLAVAALLLTGCMKITDDLDSVVSAIMNDNKIAVNTVSTGYELYIPTGVKQKFDSQYNQKFKIRDTYVYLYVDTVSYYYKNSLNYKSDDDYNYYYRELALNGKTGYIGINQVEDDLYFCEIVYNYSKMEFYSSLDDLGVVLANSLMIQKSIKYNDSLIEVELSGESDTGRDIKYELDKPKDAESTFSNSLQEYVADDAEEEIVLPDDN